MSDVITRSFAAHGVPPEGERASDFTIARDLGAVLGAALSGALAFEAGFAGRDPLGLTRICTDVVCRPTGPFERSHDFVPIRARGARR